MRAQGQEGSGPPTQPLALCPPPAPSGCRQKASWGVGRALPKARWSCCMLASTWGWVGGSHGSKCSPCGSAFHSAPAVCAARAMTEGWPGGDVLPQGHTSCGCGWVLQMRWAKFSPDRSLAGRGHLTSKVTGGPRCLGQRQSPRAQAARTRAGCSRGAVGRVPSLHTCPAQQAAPLVLGLQELRWGQGDSALWECTLPGVVTVQ